MNSFSSELGVQFGTCLEAPHVIDVDSQVLMNLLIMISALQIKYVSVDVFKYKIFYCRRGLL